MSSAAGGGGGSRSERRLLMEAKAGVGAAIAEVPSAGNSKGDPDFGTRDHHP